MLRSGCSEFVTVRQSAQAGGFASHPVQGRRPPALLKGRVGNAWTPSRGWSAGYRPAVGIRNYLIEGVSGTGKTSVCHELRRRGFHAINGDTELAYQADPETGEPTDVPSHWHHLWPVHRVRALVADQSERFTFFCGGSRNFATFQDLFDGVFVLDTDLETLNRRLDQRPEHEFGAQQPERDLILRLHRTKEDTPKNGILIDATEPLADVVDEVLRRARAIASSSADPADSSSLDRHQADPDERCQPPSGDPPGPRS
ncbi:hypothetical protein GCM10009562_15750 [Nocardioides aquaticus]